MDKCEYYSFKILIFEEVLRELEDFGWFPSVLRKQQTGFIGWMVRTFKVYDFLVPEIEKEAGYRTNKITDLCSGNGGPWLSLAKNKRLLSCEIMFTDLYPQMPQYLLPNCTYETTPFSALTDLEKAEGLVTMFNAFHHFNVDQRKEIVKQIIDNNKSFMACEILQPTILDFFRIVLATTIGQLLFSAFVTPFSWKRILFTYIIPINLITVTYDGVVSVFNSLGKRDWAALLEMTAEIGGEARIIRKRGIFVHTTVFICKRKAAEIL